MIRNKNVHLVFSIDTLDKEFWKFVRGNDTYDIVLSNLKYAVKQNISISIQSVLAEETREHVKNVADFSKELGVDHFTQNFVSEGFNGHWTPIQENKTSSSCDVCQAYKHNIVIMQNGDIFSCFDQPKISGFEKPVGNILKDNYSSIKNSFYLYKVLYAMKNCDLPCKVLRCNKDEGESK